MRRRIAACLGLVLGCLAAPAATGAALTPLEATWLEAAWPVLEEAQRRRLPIDIVVQPQDAPDLPPLALAYLDGRCKLVLSMRGNPAAQSALGGVPAELVPAVIEAMTAHEIGHCWRHVQGYWSSPASSAKPDDDGAVRRIWLREDMRLRRDEEGYADLVGLAWTLERHPALYPAVHAWFEQVRDAAVVPGSHHDTRAWLRLAQDARALAGQGDLFERALAVWKRGLDPR